MWYPDFGPKCLILLFQDVVRPRLLPSPAHLQGGAHPGLGSRADLSRLTHLRFGSAPLLVLQVPTLHGVQDQSPTAARPGWAVGIPGGGGRIGPSQRCQASAASSRESACTRDACMAMGRQRGHQNLQFNHRPHALPRKDVGQLSLDRPLSGSKFKQTPESRF